MSKRTVKAGISGKYGTRYGGALRKISKKYEISQHMTYNCGFCGKTSVKRVSVGIWRCKACFKTIAGGAWAPTTNNALVAKNTLLRYKKTMAEAAS